MGDRRSSRRRSRASEKAKQENEEEIDVDTNNITTPSIKIRSTKRVSSKKEKDIIQIPQQQEEEEEEEVLEEEIEAGNANDVTEHPEQSDSKRLGKRKRDRVRNIELANSKQGIRSTDTYIFFDRLLVELTDNPQCSLFLRPVLEMWEESDIPDYKQRIKSPMDLGTIRKKMSNDSYVITDKNTKQYYFNQDACASDIRLIFKNCMIYNEEESELHQTANQLLDDISERIITRENRAARMQEKAKRDSERKRRKVAEENAAIAAQKAARAAIALVKAKQEAADEKRKRELELKKKEAEWARRLEEEKVLAVKQAVQAALVKQKRAQAHAQVQAQVETQTQVHAEAITSATQGVGSSRHHQARNQSKMVNTSSVSSDEQEGHGEIQFAFVSTKGMEKKRGRKSTTVMELELQHEDLMRRRKVIMEANIELEKTKQIEMTADEKRNLCELVSQLDFVQMKGVVDIIANGMKRSDLLNEVIVDIDIETIDNHVLREAEFFLKNPVALTASHAIHNIEAEITDIETKLVEIRYQKIGN